MDSEVKAEVVARPGADSVERALSQIGDRWIFLILREAYFGVRRFDQFQTNTGASPAVLTDRLKRLVEYGLFEKRRYGRHANRFDYRLTEKGRDLYPLIVLLMKWGDRWLDDGDGPPIELTHHCGAGGSEMALRCSGCGEEIDARSVTWRASNPLDLETEDRP